MKFQEHINSTRGQKKIWINEMKEERTGNKAKCESCGQSFNHWDLLWDLHSDREVCRNCFNRANNLKLGEIKDD